MDNGFIGTEAEWLESLKGQPGPFLSCSLEAFANTQNVDVNESVFFDVSSVESAGSGIIMEPDGRRFTIFRPGLYHVEWSANVLNASPGENAAVLGIVENGEAVSGAASSSGGGFSSGTLITVTNEPVTISLYNFNSGIRIENPVGWINSSASIRIVRFADGANG